MNTGAYIPAGEVLFMASAMSGDKDYKVIPKGFYITLIQEAFRELNIDTFFRKERVSLPIPEHGLTIPLPSDCIDVRGVWIFNGDICNISNSRKVWHKNNYYTEGNGYIANNKGNNPQDPFYGNYSVLDNRVDKSLIRYDNQDNVNNLLYYNIQNGNLMISSSCRAAGSNIHIEYASTGCDVAEAPIIPQFFKVAIEDFVVEAALRFRMANMPSEAKNWAYMHGLYANRLDKEGMNGSWHTAKKRATSMNTADRRDLGDYLSRAAWATGR